MALLSVFLLSGVSLARAARIEQASEAASEQESGTELASGALLRDRYILGSFIETRGQQPGWHYAAHPGGHYGGGYGGHYGGQQPGGYGGQQPGGYGGQYGGHYGGQLPGGYGGHYGADGVYYEGGQPGGHGNHAGYPIPGFPGFPGFPGGHEQRGPTHGSAPSGVPGQSFPDIERTDFNDPRHLGTGSFGDVWSAFDTKENKTVAVKIFYAKSSGRPMYLTWKNANSHERKELGLAKSECVLVQQIMANSAKHPSGASRICACYGEHIDDAKGTNEPVFLVQEMCGSSLTSAFIGRHKQARTVDVEGARGLTAQLLEGLDFMQNFSPPLIHHDLKPDNIVITDDGDLKIIDWGGLVFGDPKNMGKPAVATPVYMPPETEGFRQAFAMPAHSYDVYAAGLIYMEMICPSLEIMQWYHKRPLNFKKVERLMRQACPTVSHSIIGEDLKLIADLINRSPTRRPSPSSALQSSLFHRTPPTPPKADNTTVISIPDSYLLPVDDVDEILEADPHDALLGSHVMRPEPEDPSDQFY